MDNQDLELKQLAQDLLCLKKNQYANFDFKTFAKLLGGLCFQCEYHRDPEPQEKYRVEELAENIISGVMERVIRLPENILATVENKREFCLGYMSEETRAALQAYVARFED